MLKQTKRLTLVEQVAEQIEDLITSGVWAVGSRVPPEPELMEQLQVSRNTLREAIRALTHAGLLKTRQGDGTYVCSSSALGPVLKKRIMRSKMLETLEVRQALEQEAVKLAALRRDEEDLVKITHCLEQCKLAINTQNPQTYAQWDIEFHQAVVSASHNDLLIELYDYISESLQHIVVELFEKADFKKYYDTHEQLLKAITERDSDKAVEIAHLFIQESQQHLTSDNTTGTGGHLHESNKQPDPTRG